MKFGIGGMNEGGPGGIENMGGGLNPGGKLIGGSFAKSTDVGMFAKVGSGGAGTVVAAVDCGLVTT